MLVSNGAHQNQTA